MEIKKTRTPTCAEWDCLVAAVNGENDAMHWREIFSWCADDIETSRTCVIRGYCSPGHWHRGNPVLRVSCTGFRPAFEIPNPDGIADGVPVLVGTLYMDGKPIWTNHAYAHDIPDYIPGATLEIGPPLNDPSYRIWAIKAGGVLIADRNLLKNVSRQDLREQEFC